MGLGVDVEATESVAEQAACSALKSKIAADTGMPLSGPSDESWSGWFCDFADRIDGYYVIALRSNRPAPYSNLMGWYAVQSETSTVFSWNLEEQKAVPLREGD
jgi:hypothetical protein